MFSQATNQKLDEMYGGDYREAWWGVDDPMEDWFEDPWGEYMQEQINEEKGRTYESEEDSDGDPHEYQQWQELTPAEKKILKRNWNIVLDLNKNRETAEKLTDQYFPDAKGWKDNADAFRHAMFSGLNTRSFGDYLAMQLGFAHENFPDNPPLENIMDLYNNRIGRYYGNSFPEISIEDLANIIYNATVNGKLIMIENNCRLIPTFVQ